MPRQQKRRDFTNAKRAPVMVCFVRWGERYLLLKRSDKVLAYGNMWSGVAGFIDTDEPIEEQVARELLEEIGCPSSSILSANEILVYEFFDKELNRTWERHVFLVEVTSPKVRINWEHSEYRWLNADQCAALKTTPGLIADLKTVSDIRPPVHRKTASS